MQLFPGNSSQQKEALNYRTHKNTFNYGKNYRCCGHRPREVQRM